MTDYSQIKVGTTRQQVIDFIAEKLWTAGVGNRKSGPLVAADIVDSLIKAGLLKVDR